MGLKIGSKAILKAYIFLGIGSGNNILRVLFQ